jgi:hypothetical protein
VSGEPFSETTNPAFKASAMGLIDSVDTMILGAITYAQAKGYWPPRHHPKATKLSPTTAPPPAPPPSAAR